MLKLQQKTLCIFSTTYPETGIEYRLDSDRYIFFRRLLLTVPLPCKHFFLTSFLYHYTADGKL